MLRGVVVSPEVELDARTVSRLAIDLDVSAALPDEAVDHAEAKPGSLAFRLCREERVEGAGDDLRRHARSRIAERDENILSGDHLKMSGGVGLVEHDIGELDRQFAAVAHRGGGIERQVEDRRFELDRIEDGAPQTAAADELDLDGFSDGAPNELQEGRHQFGEDHDLLLERLLAGKGHQLANDFRATKGGVEGELQAAAVLLGDRRVMLDVVEIEDHHGRSEEHTSELQSPDH